ncbi:MAG TPA: TolC family protein [Terriglobales bacterium]|nr:TolC family protein [Terriglobales bacterium]
MRMQLWRQRLTVLASLLTLLFLPALHAEELTFRRAVELALRNSTTTAIADADQRRAKQGYLETRGMFLPQMSVGSGLGYSYGFPLSLENSAPSILNVNTQQFIINAAQREFMRAAKSELAAMNKLGEDRRASVILETAMTYAELDRLQVSLKALRQQEAAAQKVETVSRERLQAGVDAEVEVSRARLGVAKVHMATEQAAGQADVLRLRLSQLTGLPADSIVTVSESVPRMPPIGERQAMLSKAMESNPSIQVAAEQAQAREFRAKGERKMMLPAVDFASQYALLARYNNYDKFFASFQRHNVSVGVVIRFPFLNFSQRARADAADAETMKARKEAEGVKQQVATESLKLQQAVRQLAAAKEVARLEYQIASADVQVVLARVEAGSATVRDQENARLLEQQRYAALIDAELELDKAQMQLLRSTGELEKWALGQ